MGAPIQISAAWFPPHVCRLSKLSPKNSPGKDEGHINRTDVQCTWGEKNRDWRWSLSHLGGSLLPAWYHGGKRGQWRLEEGGEWHQPPRLPLCWRSNCDNSSYTCLLSKVSNLCCKLSSNILPQRAPDTAKQLSNTGTFVFHERIQVGFSWFF